MINYIVEAKSRKNLRECAYEFRKIFNFDDVLYFPIVEVLDFMPEIFDGFSYEIVEDCTFSKDIHADTDIMAQHIRIKESVYEGACNGIGRDRMTIAHEIGHYFTMCICGFKLQRNFGKRKTRTYQDPEWQAKCFAGELMIPAHLINSMDANEIADKCGVSHEAANFQYKILKK